ncbi:hypothetical protein [Rhizobium sp. Root1220]|uniref:hypothetical protein n=1 Tax=Rhizobium sp. Root1220 TaxID=1736432 RepID=UPI0006F5FBD9|nr:hypothetical protein [Rhizobium sp. Root1220]KQV78184.1 hypothetical protein ASC90_27040 [Rhizobium sp. Root1220]
MKGYTLDFGPEVDDEPLNLQRLKLESETRQRLETMPNFTLHELAGYCPVQGQGDLEGQYWYFRARGSKWRFELGGNENFTKAPSWWHGEYWPSVDGFAAGYLTDEDAIGCILKAVELYQRGDRGRFESGHPGYERTILEGWSLGALSLHRVVKRLNITGAQALEQTKAFGIDRELEALDEPRPYVHGFNRDLGKWVELKEEDD